MLQKAREEEEMFRQCGACGLACLLHFQIGYEYFDGFVNVTSVASLFFFVITTHLINQPLFFFNTEKDSLHKFNVPFSKDLFDIKHGRHIGLTSVHQHQSDLSSYWHSYYVSGED